MIIYHDPISPLYPVQSIHQSNHIQNRYCKKRFVSIGNRRHLSKRSDQGAYKKVSPWMQAIWRKKFFNGGWNAKIMSTPFRVKFRHFLFSSFALSAFHVNQIYHNV